VEEENNLFLDRIRNNHYDFFNAIQHTICCLVVHFNLGRFSNQRGTPNVSSMARKKIKSIDILIGVQFDLKLKKRKQYSSICSFSWFIFAASSFIFRNHLSISLWKKVRGWETEKGEGKQAKCRKLTPLFSFSSSFIFSSLETTSRWRACNSSWRTCFSKKKKKKKSN